MKTIRLFGVFFLLICSVEVFCQVAVAVTTNYGLTMYNTPISLYGFSQDKDGQGYWLSALKYDGTIKGSCSVKNATIVYTSTYAYPIVKDFKSQKFNWFSSKKLENAPIGCTVSENQVILITENKAYALCQNVKGSFVWLENTLDGKPEFLKNNH